ncbi:MAG: gliding motility-associated C-terminal domain-containing protein, partial [Flavobacteriales bacterium]|nr:gliding motility-associated C-terminal domain-containing protein [Flavobacteriales bacterium]
ESDTVNLVVNPLPQVRISGDSSLCAYESITITAESREAVDFLWNTGELDSTIVINGTSILQYYNVTVTDINGCKNDANLPFKVRLLQSPEVDILYGVYGAFQNQYEFEADIIQGNIDEYTWIFGDGEQSNMPDPVHDFEQTGIFDVNLIVLDENGCYDTAEIQLNIIENIEIPNVFTPNEDGFNDNFLIPSNGMQEFLLVIYNRWGAELFRTESHKVAWDGNTHSGEPAPEGIYYFELIATGSIDHSTTGHVTLIRE